MSTPSSPLNRNALIQAAGQGDREALDQVWPDLYRQLHDLAAAQMSKEQNGGLLQTTAIVHEAYFRLSEQKRSEWPDRGSFFAAAAVVMRRILIDSARRERAVKRGGRQSRRTLSDTQLGVDDQRFEAIDLHEALEQLAQFAPDQAKALELMIFGGLTGEETAVVLGVSPATIDRKVRLAKAWLRRELSS
jgi:RNA polymerase sigma factor (TIGR02999 family)